MAGTINKDLTNAVERPRFARKESRCRKKLDGRDMTDQQHKDPLHGVTLEMMLTQLVEHHGWEKMGQIIDIRCFTNDPSIKSSLQFLRKTPWARTKVEELYVKYKKNVLKKAKQSH
jgi:uncharacterized protein (DUF2132 family)